MTRAKLLAALLAAALAFPLLAFAADPLPLDAQIQGPDKVTWVSRLREAHSAVAEARSRNLLAQDAYVRMRHRPGERGGEKAAILAEVTAAKLNLEETEARLTQLLEEARRAGVPPGWIREATPAAPQPAN
jgi:hypothetical protein